MRLGRAFCGLATILVLLSSTASVASTSAGGTQRWESAFGQTGSADSYDVAVSPDGSTVFVTGTDEAGPRGPMRTLAYDAADGELLWSKAYGSSSLPASGSSITVSPDGSRVFAAGLVCSSCPGRLERWLVVAYDAASGEQVWERRRDLPQITRDIAVTPNGAMLLVNSSGYGGNVSALSTSTGEVTWSRDMVEHTDSDDAVAVSPDSSTAYLSATEFEADCSGSDGSFRTWALDVGDGSVRWSTTTLPDQDQLCGQAQSTALSSDGSRVVAAGRRFDGGPAGSVVVSYDAISGERLSTVELGDVDSLGEEGGVILDRTGSVAYLAGNADRTSGDLLVTTGVDLTTGERLWTTHYDSGRSADPEAVRLAPDQSTVYVAGEAVVWCWLDCPTASPTRGEALLLAYDPETGAQRWVMRRQDDGVSAMAAGADGTAVYLAGSFTSALSSARDADDSSPRLTGCGSRCGMSISATNARGGPARIEDRDPSVRFDGWVNRFEADAVGGSYRASRTAGDTFTFETPAGTALRWVARQGPAMGMARVYVDGRARRTVDLFSPTRSSRSLLFDGLEDRRHRVRVEVLGRKSAQSRGAWVAVDAFRVPGRRLVIDETSWLVRYGAWAGRHRSEASGGTLRRTARQGSAMSLTFRGRSVRWVTATGPALGKARVLIDGVGRTVDLYSARPRWRMSLAFTGLGRGEHRVTVKPLGRKNAASRGRTVISDAFVVRP
jgi:outer membrane protein assembly factor BamB